jgi:hypothetical protein
LFLISLPPLQISQLTKDKGVFAALNIDNNVRNFPNRTTELMKDLGNNNNLDDAISTTAVGHNNLTDDVTLLPRPDLLTSIKAANSTDSDEDQLAKSGQSLVPDRPRRQNPHQSAKKRAINYAKSKLEMEPENSGANNNWNTSTKIVQELFVGKKNHEEPGNNRGIADLHWEV